MIRRFTGPVLLLAVIVAAVLYLATSGSSGYVVRAEFADVDGLTPKFDVREDGVVIGTVTGVSVTRQDTAMVTMSLDASAAPIGAGAGASIHPSNLLGEKYVQIDPGNTRRPQPSNALIPMSRTSVSPELDQVLDTFNANTREATAVFLAQEGDALLGRGGDLAATLQELPGSLGATQQFVSGLASDNVALGRLITQSDAILAQVTPQRAALGHLVNRADGFLQTLASRQDGLRGTIAQAPSTIAQLRTSLYALADAAAPLGPAAAGLRATAPSLTRTLDELPGFTTAATPTLRTLSSEASTLVRLGDDAVPLIRALDPTAARLVSFSSAFGPFTTTVSKNFIPLLNVLDGWARAIQDRDGIGHIYRIEITVPSSVITGALGAAGDTPAKRRTKSRPSSHGTTSPSGLSSVTAPLGSTVGSVGHGVSGLLGRLLGAASGGHGGTRASVPILSKVLSTVTTPRSSSPSPGGSGVGSLLNYLLGK